MEIPAGLISEQFPRELARFNCFHQIDNFLISANFYKHVFLCKTSKIYICKMLY